jgi:hypothetical protein
MSGGQYAWSHDGIEEDMVQDAGIPSHMKMWIDDN